jgi:ribosomal protein S18 acetylase RimI-like enzyme
MKAELMDAVQAVGERDALTALLTDTVDGGAAVGFLPPLDARTAEEYWTGVAEAIEHAGRKLLAVRTDGVLAGAVQLQRAVMPNGRHRGEVMKLMVHRRFRRRGVAAQLMAAAEEEARRQGITLLVLDTRQGDVAEGLYRRLGWHSAGVIPRYARSADGTLHATVIFYKELTEAERA